MKKKFLHRFGWLRAKTHHHHHFNITLESLKKVERERAKKARKSYAKAIFSLAPCVDAI
jgi:hypothetical protein